MPFRKGKSGNPGGRLRRGLTITDHLKELLDNDYAEFKLLHKYLEEKGEEHLGPITVARLVACRIISQAMTGQAELTKELLNRADGKISDRLEISQRSLSLQIVLTSRAREIPANEPKQDLGNLPREPAALPDPTIHEGENVSSK